MLYSVDKVSTHVDIASVSVDIRSYDAAAAECRERPRAGSHTLRDASQDARRAIDRFPELGTKCSQVLIAVGRQRQPVWMRFGRPVVVIEYVFLLPGEVAASIRAQAG